MLVFVWCSFFLVDRLFASHRCHRESHMCLLVTRMAVYIERESLFRPHHEVERIFCAGSSAACRHKRRHKHSSRRVIAVEKLGGQSCQDRARALSLSCQRFASEVVIPALSVIFGCWSRTKQPKSINKMKRTTNGPLLSTSDFQTTLKEPSFN